MIKEIADTPIEMVDGRDPARVKIDTSMNDVVKAMASQRRGAALVEDTDGHIIGIFTERDLMTKIDHTNHEWRKLPVKQFMVSPAQCIEGSGTIRHALNTMRKGRFRHLPIVNSETKIQGIVSIRGILVHIVSYFATELLNLPPDSDHETSEQWGG